MIRKLLFRKHKLYGSLGSSRNWKGRTRSQADKDHDLVTEAVWLCNFDALCFVELFSRALKFAELSLALWVTMLFQPEELWVARPDSCRAIRSVHRHHSLSAHECSSNPLYTVHLWASTAFVSLTSSMPKSIFSHSTTKTASSTRFHSSRWVIYVMKESLTAHGETFNWLLSCTGKI